MAEEFDTSSLKDAQVVTARDGSAVRPLCRITGAGSFAHFKLDQARWQGPYRTRPYRRSGT
jgi:hypothetical protein